MALIANVHRDGKKRPEPFTAADFLTGSQPKEPEPEKVTGGLPDARMSPVNQKIYMSLFFAAQRMVDGPRKEGAN